MSAPVLRCAGCVSTALVAAALACSADGGTRGPRVGDRTAMAPPATVTLARQDPQGHTATTDTAGHIVIRYERSYGLAEHESPFRFALEARGPEIEALDVRLAIYDAGDTLRYQSTWPSARYVMCESDGCALDSFPPAARDSIVRRELVGVLGDDALSPGVSGSDAAGASWGWWTDSSLMPEVHRRLARQLWLLERGRDARDGITLEEANTIGRGGPALRERVALLTEDLRGRPVFSYSTGSVGYCKLAWSPRERAIFDVDCVW